MLFRSRIYSKVAENSSVDRDTVAQFLAEDFIVSVDLFEDIHRAGADPKAEKMARELMADDIGIEDARKIADYLNQFVNDVIQRCAGIEPGDFRDVFQDYVQSDQVHFHLHGSRQSSRSCLSFYSCHSKSVRCRDSAVQNSFCLVRS